MIHSARVSGAIYVLLLALCLAAPTTPARAQVMPQDSLALVALYNSTNGASWTTTWDLNTPVDTWHGITVSGNRVTAINLLNNNLNGPLPASIGDLTALTNLWLGGDPISGSLPASIGSLTNVTGFYIYLTNLSGSIPPEIGDMTSLYVLLLESNNLSGTIPAAIGNLTNLYTLKLYNNGLTGAIPTQIGSMSNLGIMDLNNNNLSGSIPTEIGSLANLKELSLWGNSLSGSIPAVIGNLGNLEKLYLNHNQLTGTIPTEIGNLANLEVLSLGDNQITGTLPTQIGNLTNLLFLRLASGQFSGAIPTTITNCTMLNQLYIQDNQFDGLPNLSSLSYLASLVIENNNFTFEDIEPNVGAASQFFDYSPQANVGQTENITILENTDRTISVTVGGSANLYQWLKDGAEISGANNDSYVISNAQFADEGVYTCRITNASVTGLTLTSYPFNVSLASLATEQDSLALVDLYNSTDGPNWVEPYKSDWLSGPISEWPGLLMTNGRVTYLSLANANLTGTIPASIGDLTELTKLKLYNNNLTGPIPAAIGNLTALIELELRLNELSGSIPSTIGNWTSLTWLYLGGNQLTGSIPPEIGSLTNLTYLWLFDNQLSGTIPPEIGDLVNLTDLRLANNQLSGPAPSELANLSQLMTFYIDGNLLEDFPSLSAINPLNYLRVQNNKLNFEAIERNIDVPTYNYTYSPQDSVGIESDTSVADGASLTLSVTVGGTANLYQWLQDGVDIPGATADSYTIASATSADMGSYVLRSTNPLAPACSLYSRPAHVTVVDVAPAPPKSLMAVAGDRQVSLVWQPNTEGDFLRYRIYGGLSPDPTVAVDSTDGIYATALTVAGLDNGAVYFLRLTAVDAALNESDYSAQIGVTPYDRPPIAVADTAVTLEDVPVDIDVLANDHELEGRIIFITATTQGAHGAVVVNADSTVTYTPTPDFNGTDSFIYLMSNGEEEVALGTVTMTVTPVNDAPAAFALVPQASSITVSPNAPGDTLVFAWEEAADVDGDLVTYHFAPTGNLTLLGLGDTTATEIKLAHADIWALMNGAEVTTLAGTWTVSASDGEYAVEADDGPIAITIYASSLSVEGVTGVPQTFALHPAYPNPFNPSTTIRFDLPVATDMQLAVYDLLGREVTRLVNGHLEAGYHQQVWNGRDRDGREVPSGIYFVLVVTPEFRKSIKTVLLK